MDMNKFARDNDLARKFEKAIEKLDRSKGWEIFAGLDKGPIQVGMVYDGSVRFIAIKKAPKKKAKAKKVKVPPKGDALNREDGGKVKAIIGTSPGSEDLLPMTVDPDANKTEKTEG